MHSQGKTTQKAANGKSIKNSATINSKQRGVKKGQDVKTTNEMLHTNPLAYGSSLLRDLDSTPNVVKRPPSRGGVGFAIDSGCYHYGSTTRPCRSGEDKDKVRKSPNDD
jgi:hypothetical protein